MLGPPRSGRRMGQAPDRSRRERAQALADPSAAVELPVFLGRRETVAAGGGEDSQVDHPAAHRGVGCDGSGATPCGFVAWLKAIGGPTVGDAARRGYVADFGQLCEAD